MPDRQYKRLCALSHSARSTGQRRYLSVRVAATIALALALHVHDAHSATEQTQLPAPAHNSSGAPPNAGSSGGGGTSLNAVTIQAAHARQELERRVRHYVASEVVTYLHDSLARWNQPICPIVAGLPLREGAYVFKRISSVASAAGARMGGARCKPNLYVVATPYTDLLLKKWRERDPTMYDLCNGLGPVKEFLHSHRPVRAWYNTEFTSESGKAVALDTNKLPFFNPFRGCVSGSDNPGTRIRYSAVQSLGSVIVIVDLNRIRSLTIGQLADYVVMVSLAQIQAEADPGAAPTILTVFRGATHPPQGLTAWDQAFLHALYNTSQSNVLEVSLIEHSMVSQITAPFR